MRQPKRHLRNRGSSGYVAADAVIALAILLLLLTVLSVSVSRQRHGSERLADSRAAIRLAEETITAMQSGAAPPAAAQGMTVAVRPTQAQHDLQPPAGLAWVDVVVSYNHGRSSSLSGLVRADAAKGAVK
jgi:type II secretory pathway pseudopilin PulG